VSRRPTHPFRAGARDDQERRLATLFFEGRYYQQGTERFGIASFPITTGSLLVPAENPFNPFGVGTTFAGRLLGNQSPDRVEEVDLDSFHIVAGLEGDLPGVDGWSYTLSGVYSREDYVLHTSDTDLISAQNALNGFGGPDCQVSSLGVPAAAEVAGEGNCIYLSPFGRDQQLNDSRVSYNILTPYNRAEESELRYVEAVITGELFDLPGGTIGVAIGGQMRGSYSTALRAPDVEETVSDSVTSGVGQTVDPLDPTDTGTFRTIRRVSNPDLRPEQSRNYNLGASIEPVENLVLSVDYFNFRFTDQIALEAAQLHQQGYAPKTHVRELERESKRLEGEGGALRAGVAEAQSIVAEARLEIERSEETSREDALAELRDVEVSVAELEERRVAAMDALRRTEIRAPYAGRVLGLAVHTVGGVIAPGAALMEIVPGGDRLQVAAQVAPQDIDKVRAGQETLVRFSAFGSRRTPEAQGIVKTVSADSLVDEAIGAPYYLVIVEIPEGEALSSLLGGAALAPGMPVETFIRTGSKPAISYLLKPLADAMSRSMREE
jgi:hypothetical protein